MTDKTDLLGLVKRLRHRDPFVRQTSATAVGKFGREAEVAVGVLTEMVCDANANVATAVARTLGRIGPSAVPALVGALEHPAKQVRREAAWALKNLGPESAAAVPALTVALADGDTRVRMAAAHALGAIGPAAAAAIPTLIDCLKSINIIFCRLAAEALSRIGQVALPALLQEIHGHDHHVCREAAWAIRQIVPDLEHLDAALVDTLKGDDASLAPTAPDPATHVVTVPIPLEPRPVTYLARSADAG